MNQIELSKALKDTTSNAAESAIKVFMHGYGDKLELTTLSILGIGITSWYFINKQFLAGKKCKI